MKKFYVMGNYSAKAFQGFVKDPSQDRKKAVETILQATGGKIHSFDIVRGNVDFVAVVDADVASDCACSIELVKEEEAALDAVVAKSCAFC